jgi:hypothetical protein
VNSPIEWISLEDDGRDWLESQIKELTHLARWVQGEHGDMILRSEWSLSLAKELLDEHKIRQGSTFAAAFGGVAVESVIGSFEELDDSVLDATISAFRHGMSGKMHSGQSVYCLIPSSHRSASDKWFERQSTLELPFTRVLSNKEGLYGIVSMPNSVGELRKVLDDVQSEIAFSPPILAICGSPTFDEQCDEAWKTRSLSDLQLSRLAESATRILAKVGTCGGALLWAAD